MTVKIVRETFCIEVGRGEFEGASIAEDGYTRWLKCQGLDANGNLRAYNRDVSVYNDGMVIKVHPFDMRLLSAPIV